MWKSKFVYMWVQVCTVFWRQVCSFKELHSNLFHELILSEVGANAIWSLQTSLLLLQGTDVSQTALDYAWQVKDPRCHGGFWKGCSSAKTELGVSKNSGTPKTPILIGFSIVNHPFWGTIIFGNTQLFYKVLVFRISLLYPSIPNFQSPVALVERLPYSNHHI